MDPIVPREADPAGAAAADAPLRQAARFWVVRTIRWHVLAMLAANLLLSGINIAMGGSWWAFWPLMVTGALLAVHYFFYKAIAVDRHWVDERVEELNLKSYDRSHIEDLKSRYGGGNEPGDSPR